MKRSILLLSGILTFIALSAQTIQLTDKGGNNVGNNMTITLGEEPGHTDILSYLDVTNSSASTMNILCKKSEMSLITGSTNTFCWTQCYPPFTIVSPTPIILAAGQTDSISFVGEYYSNGNTGTSRIAYTFFDEYNANDSIRVIVDYAYNVIGLAEQIAEGKYSISPAYPNPAGAQTSFNYDLPAFNNARLSIMNLLGSEVKSLALDGRKGKLTVNLRDLTEGVYFYTLFIDGEALATHKLIIKR